MAQATNKSIRRWRVSPDQILQTNRGDIECISDEALFAGLIKGGQIVQAMGGKLLLDVGREPTDLHGEAVTTQAIVSWVPHINATVEPEPATRLADLPELEDDYEDAEPPAELSEEDDRALTEALQ